MKNNITNLNEYKNQKPQDMELMEEFSDEMVQAYIDASGMDTPDLWSRIEAGFHEECSTLKKEKQHSKKMRSRMFGAAAAVVLITLIAIPVISMFGGERKHKDKSEGIITEGCKDEAVMENTKEEEYMEQDGFMDEAAASQSEFQEDAQMNETDAMVTDDEQVKDDRSLVVVGEFVDYEEFIFQVNQIIENQYSDMELVEGDKIKISNPEVISTLDRDIPPNIQLTMDSFYQDEDGTMFARIVDIEF